MPGPKSLDPELRCHSLVKIAETVQEFVHVWHMQQALQGLLLPSQFVLVSLARYADAVQGEKQHPPSMSGTCASVLSQIRVSGS